MKSGPQKAYIRVEAWFGEDGAVHPTCVIWGDGKRYPVGSVLDVRPGIRSQDWGMKSYAERCALNTPIQGTAADILKLALGRLIAGLPDRQWLKPLLQIHDELVFEVPADRITEAIQYVKNCMEAQPFPEFDVPIVAEAACGPDFGHMTEME